MSPRTDEASDTLANLFIGVVAAAGATVLGSSLYRLAGAGFETKDLAWVGIALLTVFLGRLSVKLPLPHCRVSFSDAFIFLSVMVFGRDLATLTAALDGFASSSRDKGTLHKRVFNTAGMALSVNLASRLFTRLLPDLGRPGSAATLLELLMPAAALAVAQYLVNTALVSCVVALKEHQSIVAVWRGSSLWAGTAYLAGSLAATLVFLIVHSLGVVSAFAVVPFPVALYLTYRACLERRAGVKAAPTL